MKRPHSSTVLSGPSSWPSPNCDNPVRSTRQLQCGRLEAPPPLQGDRGRYGYVCTWANFTGNANEIIRWSSLFFLTKSIRQHPSILLRTRLEVYKGYRPSKSRNCFHIYSAFRLSGSFEPYSKFSNLPPLSHQAYYVPVSWRGTDPQLDLLRLLQTPLPALLYTLHAPRCTAPHIPDTRTTISGVGEPRGLDYHPLQFAARISAASGAEL